LISSDGHDVDTPTSGIHHCDGMNDHSYPTPGNTPTSTLSSAAAIGNFIFDGKYYDDFDDFLITQIGEDIQTEAEYWHVLLNYQHLKKGGCQVQTNPYDEVLWAFAPVKTRFLKLYIAPVIIREHAATASVIDAETGLPVPGVTVECVNDSFCIGGQTGLDGEVEVFFLSGIHAYVKAFEPNSVRSNLVQVEVI
jgi:hypothetical protein